MPTINEMLAAHLTIQTRVKHNENRKSLVSQNWSLYAGQNIPQNRGNLKSQVGHLRILHEREKNQNLHTPKVNLPGG